MKAIGGYFELELTKSKEYHKNALCLNTGRNALEYILKANSYRKIYIPYFTCDVLLQPIQKLGVKLEFYTIDEQFEPVFNYSILKEDECFLYTNYFGLKDSFIKTMPSKCKNLVIDNAQSFYSKPIDNIDTFYSPRKFFGLTDGAYLYSNKEIVEKLSKDLSYERFEHLLKRIDQNAEEGYNVFTLNDEKLNNLPILKMSNLTRRILESIDYSSIAKQRIENYIYLDKKLKASNRLKIDFNQNQVPMVYPYWSKDKNLRQRLMENKIYTASYWANVKNWCEKESLENRLTGEVVFLTVDQRYGEEEMNLIIDIINQKL